MLTGFYQFVSSHTISFAILTLLTSEKHLFFFLQKKYYSSYLNAIVSYYT